MSTGFGVELWGYPGAGKSTVSQLLRKRGVEVVRLPSFVRNSFRRPFVTASSLLQPPLFRGVVPGHAGHGNLARTAICQRSTFQADPGAVLEEGLTHEIWRTLFRFPGLERAAWLPYVPLVAPNIIVLSVEPAEALRRIRGKSGLGPVNRKLASSTLDGPTWEACAAAYESLLSAVRAAPHTSVRLIEADALTAAQAADRVFDHVAAVREEGLSAS